MLKSITRYTQALIVVIVYFLPLGIHSITGQHAQPLVLSGTDEQFMLESQHIEVFEDKTQELVIDEVTQPEFDARFKKVQNGNRTLDVQNLGSAYWLRFKIQDRNNDKRRWVLENMDPHIDHFDFYLYDTDSAKYINYKAGYLIKFKKRTFQHKNFIFDLPVNAHENYYYYVRVTSHNHNPFLFKIQTFNNFSAYSLNEYYFLGIFYGVMIIMALYNLLLFFSIKERIYIYYSIYVLSCILISFAEDGLGFQYVWSNTPVLNVVFGDFKAIIFMVSLMFYSMAFLELKKRNKSEWKLINYVTIGYVVYYLLVSFLVSDKQLSGVLRSAFKIVPFILIYYSAIKAYRNGYKPARYFILGYSFVFISIVFLIFRETGILHWYDIFSVYSFNFGLVFETVILSLALGDKIKLIKHDRELAQQEIIEQLQENEKLKDKVNRELEGKVNERTVELNEKNTELEEAYQKLQDQAEEINQMNLMLDLNNRKLQSDVKELSKARVMSKEVNFEEFNKIYPNKESCLKYLAELKWSTDYTCKKCGHKKHCRGKSMYSRRCTRCRYDESATAFTIFHRLKFPITKAFYMVFLIYESKEKVTSSELSQTLDLRQSTCWNFSKKIQTAMDIAKKNNGNKPISGWGEVVLEKI